MELKNKNQARLRLVTDNKDLRDADSGGYKSGRSSCLGTPDAASTQSTLSAGTRPDLRQRCTAWYRTPQCSASEPSPLTPSIARSTGFMQVNLQPIVARSQQSIRGLDLATMQLMVATTKKQAREEFSKNLNRELDRLKAPQRGRPKWLQKELKNIVTYESCRKWLKGLDIPDQGNLSVLVDTLGLNQQYLRTGTWESAPGASDNRFSELQKIWPDLDEKYQDHLVETARMGRKASSPPERAAPPRRQRA